MKLEFVKMSGAGNDFIVLNNMDSTLDSILNTDFIRNTCRRGLSVGADGLIEMRSDPEYAFRMKYYNNDGKLAEMCGNGGRCIARFAASTGIVTESGIFSFRSDAGVHLAEITGPDCVRLWMTKPQIHFIDHSIPFLSGDIRLSFLDTGVPHAVVFTDDDNFNGITKMAPLLRKHQIFGEKGANVNFVFITGKSELRMRTWERGIEDETFACGTGAVASVICANILHELELPVRVLVKSGLVLNVGKNSSGWWLEGEARLVYSGILKNPCLEV